MNKMTSLKRTAQILAMIAIVLLIVGVFAMTRPVSYGLHYYNASMYDSDDFNGSLTFYADNSMLIDNTNFDEPFKSYYYYKNGYVFFPMSETEEEYKAEVEEIEAEFEGAINAPFYAAKISVFSTRSEESDGYATVYTCMFAVFMAMAGGVVEIVLILFTASYWKKYKKMRDQK